MDESLIKGEPIQGKTVNNEPSENLQTLANPAEDKKSPADAPE